MHCNSLILEDSQESSRRVQKHLFFFLRIHPCHTQHFPCVKKTAHLTFSPLDLKMLALPFRCLLPMENRGGNEMVFTLRTWHTYLPLQQRSYLQFFRFVDTQYKQDDLNREGTRNGGQSINHMQRHRTFRRFSWALFWISCLSPAVSVLGPPGNAGQVCFFTCPRQDDLHSKKDTTDPKNSLSVPRRHCMTTNQTKPSTSLSTVPLCDFHVSSSKTRKTPSRRRHRAANQIKPVFE